MEGRGAVRALAVPSAHRKGELKTLKCLQRPEPLSLEVPMGVGGGLGEKGPSGNQQTERWGWGADNACEIDFSFCLLNCGAGKAGERPARGEGWGMEGGAPGGVACLQLGLVSDSATGRVMKMICCN